MLDWINIVQDKGVGEILLSSVDCDGMMQGMDEKLINNVKTKVPLIASSGVGQYKHLNFLQNVNVDAVAIGAGLHYNNITVSEIKDKLSQLNKVVRNKWSIVQ